MTSISEDVPAKKNDVMKIDEIIIKYSEIEIGISCIGLRNK